MMKKTIIFYLFLAAVPAILSVLTFELIKAKEARAQCVNYFLAACGPNDGCVVPCGVAGFTLAPPGQLTTSTNGGQYSNQDFNTGLCKTN